MKKDAIIISTIFFLVIFGWSVFDYYISDFFGSDVLAAAGTRTASLSVTVGQGMTLTQLSGATVAFGTLTAGTPVTGTTQLRVSTNGTGMNITAGRLRANTTPATLASNADPYTVSSQIDDDSGGIDVFSAIGDCTAATSEPKPWSDGNSNGLGYTNWAFSGGDARSTTCWGSGSTETDSSNQYGALQASASAASFISSDGFSSVATEASVGYRLDVTGTQKATEYSGGVVFTATSNP